MTIRLNADTLLWAIGVVQPASLSEIRDVFAKLVAENIDPPSLSTIRAGVEKHIEAKHVVRVGHDREQYFSLTYAGQRYLPKGLRKLRDKARLLLLNKARRSKFYLSRGNCPEELAGVAPASDTSRDLKGDAANKPVGLRASGQQAYWPRLSQRLLHETGPKADPRDATFSYLSFSSEAELRVACGYKANTPLFDVIGIGVCLGISPGLVQKILFRPELHYRSFNLRKKGGGVRQIDSPRVFLKTIQSFIADYVLCDLLVHDGVHSYRRLKSIVTNSSMHEGKKYVANIDIKNFFGSITRARLIRLLVNAGFDRAEAVAISHLSTKDKVLPQGAPTSPVLSNAFLFKFDTAMDRACHRNSLVYTRYADDITISGSEKKKIERMIEKAELTLKADFGLRLNSAKKRIASTGGQQVVTGVVVNEQAAPPRKFRRQIRAMVHNAEVHGNIDDEKYFKILGYVNYLRSFPRFRNSSIAVGYIEELRAARKPPGKRHGVRDRNRTASEKLAREAKHKRGSRQ